jgi:hypothetical protein
MKKDTTHSSLLGLTQREMALLLQVHTSQWSMYESGKRDLPLKAKKVLAEMLGFLKFESKSIMVLQLIIEQKQAMKKCLDNLLKENEYQLCKISKKIALAERKYNDYIGVIGLMNYLRTLPSSTEALDGKLLEIISSKSERALMKSGLAYLTELRLKEELLQQEKILLDSALNKIN